MKSKKWPDTLGDTLDEIECCTECGDSVALGSGKYVNRIPMDVGTTVGSGWLCSDCQLEECDRCEELHAEVFTIEDLMDAEHVCFDCLTEEERTELGRN